jgi:ATP-binding cassette subfamily C exporter for protease/lipase
LDDVPVADWDRTELGPHLGYLPQDIELFDGTIAENIGRLGNVDSKQVIAAARAAGVHEMILRFPSGYDTPMGIAGSLLSAGQRQRIALARALYGEPSLLVLDEPNANLDDAGEAALLQAMQNFKAMGKTIIAVSHRGGIIGLADRILILNQGRLQAFGPRDVLLKPVEVVAAQA